MPGNVDDDQSDSCAYTTGLRAHRIALNVRIRSFDQTADGMAIRDAVRQPLPVALCLLHAAMQICRLLQPPGLLVKPFAQQRPRARTRRCTALAHLDKLCSVLEREAEGQCIAYETNPGDASIRNAR